MTEFELHVQRAVDSLQTATLLIDRVANTAALVTRRAHQNVQRDAAQARAAMTAAAEALRAAANAAEGGAR